MSNLLFIQPLNCSLHEMCFSLKKFHLVLLGIHLLLFSTIYFFLNVSKSPVYPFVHFKYAYFRYSEVSRWSNPDSTLFSIGFSL